MTTVGFRGQYSWFAFGATTGAFIASTIETLLCSPQPSPTAHKPPPELIVPLLILIGPMMALPFLIWIWIRSRIAGQLGVAPFVLPLILGIVYFPLAYGLLVLVREFTQIDQPMIGLFFGAVFYGVPVVFAEVSFRDSHRYELDSPSGRS